MSLIWKNKVVTDTWFRCSDRAEWVSPRTARRCLPVHSADSTHLHCSLSMSSWRYGEGASNKSKYMKFREIERNRYPTSFEFEKLWRHMPVKTGHSQRNHMKCVSRLDENKKFLKTETESSAKNLSEPKSELSNPKTTATRKCRDVVSYILKIYKIKK